MFSRSTAVASMACEIGWHAFCSDDYAGRSPDEMLNLITALLISVVFLILPREVRASAFQPAGKWNHLEIKVCWAPNNSLPSIRDIQNEMRTSIEKEYTRERTVIFFSGWQVCDLVSGPEVKPKGMDVVLSIDVIPGEKSIQGTSDIGLSVEDGAAGFRRLAPPYPARHVYFTFPESSVLHFDSRSPGTRLTWREIAGMTAIHEFGHLAGLLHEHLAFLDDLMNDPECTWTGISNLIRFYGMKGIRMEGAIRGSYDSSSQMNYCYEAQMLLLGSDFLALPASAFTTSTGQVYDGLYRGLSENSDEEIVLPAFSRFIDPSLFSVVPSPTPLLPDRVRIHARIGLSAGDVEMLRKEYRSLIHSPLK